MQKEKQNIFIIGGAGFIGSHVTRYFLKSSDNVVTVYDNFSSGKYEHFAENNNHSRLKIIHAEIKDTDKLTHAMQDQQVVFHFAANPDIAKAMSQPTIDFWEGTYLMQEVLEAMRKNKIKQLLYASGSGVYGDVGTQLVCENFSPLQPISTYGASKLACESLISAYCHLFDMHAAAFRFANVVGPNQTHGVAFDFIRRLQQSPNQLNILGDGTQSKSYIYIDDVIAAMHLVWQRALHGFSCWNVATEDYVTVADIATLVTERLQLQNTEFIFEKYDRGWKGDVPKIRMNSQKIRQLGWKNQRSSYEAIKDSIDAMIEGASKCILT